MEEINYTREEFYDLVWSKPMTHLGKELGYSDNGLRKKCIKHNIPMPPAGYWMKAKFNKKVIKTKLPKFVEDETLQTISIYRSEKEEKYHDESHIRSTQLIKKEILSQKGLNFIVPTKLLKPDPMIIEVKKDLKQKRPSIISGKTGLLLSSDGCLKFEVSKSTLSRALIFMDTLVKLIKKRGHSVELSDKTYVVVNGIKIEIRIREVLQVVKFPINDYGYREYGPSGNLVFRIDSYPKGEWRDGENKSLEGFLPNILARFERISEEENERERQRIIWEENYERERQEKERLENLKRNELDNLKALLSSSTRLHKAQYLRSYIKEFEEHAKKTSSLNDEKRKWIEWAIEKADWLDPFVEKDVELLKNIDRNNF